MLLLSVSSAVLALALGFLFAWVLCRFIPGPCGRLTAWLKRRWRRWRRRYRRP